jgi:hypothetical protein
MNLLEMQKEAYILFVKSVVENGKNNRSDVVLW